MADGEIPFHLKGNFAPVSEERSITELKVRGAIPDTLEGRFLRNGPNPKSGKSAHWFLGDGMVHGIELGGGEARWYRNRFVRTRVLEDPSLKYVDELGNVDRSVVVANTNVVGHAGRIYALVENGFPTLLDRELETLGTFDFDGKLKSAMTAHPKLCPVTGEMLFFGYHFGPPLLSYHRVDASGALVQTEEVDVAGPTMIHDFAITRSQAVFMDLPVVFDMELAMRGTLPYSWSDDYQARLGLMPRDTPGAKTQWFEIDPCYVFHVMNAYDEGERVVLDVARYDDMWRGDSSNFTRAALHRWTLDRSTGSVRDEPRDDQAIEFPRIDPRLEGLRHRYGYCLGVSGGVEDRPTALIKYDMESGRRVAHDFGAARSPGEGVFAPASADAAEDEGYVMTFVYDAERNASDFVILDAQNLDAQPVAAIELQCRVPFGFHGNWIPDR